MVPKYIVSAISDVGSCYITRRSLQTIELRGASEEPLLCGAFFLIIDCFLYWFLYGRAIRFCESYSGWQINSECLYNYGKRKDMRMCKDKHKCLIIEWSVTEHKYGTCLLYTCWYFPYNRRYLTHLITWVYTFTCICVFEWLHQR